MGKTLLARPHIRHASFISTHTSCHAAVGSLVLPDIRHATLL